ncbi:MAG: dihydropteroate synthase [Cytophagaceae bacterium]|jgi:dihydropteroate synthase|nr:dihydropteroate synthase [Cytophagaceae bacterium]
MSFKDTFFYKKYTLSQKGFLWSVYTPMVMGIVNCTPDSFFDGGNYSQEDALKIHIDRLIAEGAQALDVGGYSSRPGAADVSISVEWSRIAPAIEYISNQYPDILLSVDTFRSDIAAQALAVGAHMINDISAGTYDSKMYSVVANYQAIYALMHMRGTPQTMSGLTNYSDVVNEVFEFFIQTLAKTKAAGIKDVLIDPGFGFAKTVEQNYQLLKQLDILNLLEVPLMVGVSRKSMIYKPLQTSPQEALNGTSVLHTIALTKQASILRVHDVKAAQETILLMKQLYN